MLYREDALNTHVCVHHGCILKRLALAATAAPAQKRIKGNPQNNYSNSSLHKTYNRKSQARQTQYLIHVNYLEVWELAYILDAFHQ